MTSFFDIEGKCLREFYDRRIDRCFDEVKIIGDADDPRTSEAIIETVMACTIDNKFVAVIKLQKDGLLRETTFEKEVMRHGNSLVLRVTEEARRLGLGPGDTVTVMMRRK